MFIVFLYFYTFTMTYDTIKQNVVELYRRYSSGTRHDPTQTIAEMDAAMGGITSVRFNSGKRFTLANHNFCVSLPYSGMRGRRDEPVYALAFAAYLKARENGSRQPGEIHIDKNRSTKHHKEGLASLL